MNNNNNNFKDSENNNNVNGKLENDQQQEQDKDQDQDLKFGSKLNGEASFAADNNNNDGDGDKDWQFNLGDGDKFKGVHLMAMNPNRAHEEIDHFGHLNLKGQQLQANASSIEQGNLTNKTAMVSKVVLQDTTETVAESKVSQELLGGVPFIPSRVKSKCKSVSANAPVSRVLSKSSVETEFNTVYLKETDSLAVYGKLIDLLQGYSNDSQMDECYKNEINGSVYIDHQLLQYRVHIVTCHLGQGQNNNNNNNNNKAATQVKFTRMCGSTLAFNQLYNNIYRQISNAFHVCKPNINNNNTNNETNNDSKNSEKKAENNIMNTDNDNLLSVDESPLPELSFSMTSVDSSDFYNYNDNNFEMDYDFNFDDNDNKDNDIKDKNICPYSKEDINKMDTTAEYLHLTLVELMDAVTKYPKCQLQSIIVNNKQIVNSMIKCIHKSNCADVNLLRLVLIFFKQLITKDNDQNDNEDDKDNENTNTNVDADISDTLINDYKLIDVISVLNMHRSKLIKKYYVRLLAALTSSTQFKNYVNNNDDENNNNENQSENKGAMTKQAIGDLRVQLTKDKYATEDFITSKMFDSIINCLPN